MTKLAASLRVRSLTHRRGSRALASGAATLLVGAALWLPAAAAIAPGNLPARFWAGTIDGTWTGANWANDAAGTPTTAIPTAAGDVTFSISSGAGHQFTGLGKDFTIHSLTINDPTGVRIFSGNSGPRTLTISGSAGTGINLQASAGFVFFGTDFTFAGGSDTITVDNTAGALLRNGLRSSGRLIKAGSGVLTLAGPGIYGGGTTVNAGTLVIDSDTNGTFGSIGGGTTTVNGSSVFREPGGALNFLRLATAGSGVYSANGATVLSTDVFGYRPGGTINFFDTATAANGTFTINSGVSGGHGGATIFHNNSTAADGRFTVNGGAGKLADGGSMAFYDTATAGRAMITINGGTAGGGEGRLQFFDNATAGSASLTANGGTNGGAGGSIWFAGAATGTTGAVTVNENGVLDISQSDTGVSIGSLAGSSASPPFSANKVILGSKNLTVGSNNLSTTFAGNFEGDGTLTKVGTGTLTLAAFAPQGIMAVIVNAGTLRASAPFAFGNYPKTTVSAGATLDIGGQNIGVRSLTGSAGSVVQSTGGRGILNLGVNEGTATFGGAIQDGPGGRLALFMEGGVDGTGTQILNGKNTYTGGTFAGSGTLAAGNTKAFGSGDLNVFNGTVRTAGGPLVVDLGGGNIRFSDQSPNPSFTGSTYFATVGGTTPGVTHDQLKTWGTADIGGATIALVQLNGYHLKPGDKVALISADGGVSGGSADGTPLPAAKVTGLAAFSSSPLLVPVVNLYPTSVVLEALQGSFMALAGTLHFTPNQAAVAAALDSLGQIGSKTIALKEFTYLDSLAPGAIAANLDLLSPAQLTSIFNLATSLANVQSANIQRRLEDLRLDLGAVVPVNSVNVSADGASGPRGNRGTPVAPAPEDRWGVFVTGSGEFTHVGGTANAAGFNLDSGGVTAGVDYRFSDHFAAGISLGYMNTTAALAAGGKVDVDGGRVGAYATYFDRGFHVDASVSGGPNSYATRRATPNNTFATGSPEGTEVNLLLATGYDWKFKGLTIGPTASVQYTNAQLDRFTERGGFAPLNIFAQSADSTRSALGFHATFDAKVGRVLIRPEVRAAWQHEFGTVNPSLTSSFATLGGNPFTVTGSATGRDSLLIGTGFSIRWSEKFAIFAYYDGELQRSNYSSNNVSVGFRYQF